VAVHGVPRRAARTPLVLVPRGDNLLFQEIQGASISLQLGHTAVACELARWLVREVTQMVCASISW
jgi:hypothetical protein